MWRSPADCSEAVYPVVGDSSLGRSAASVSAGTRPFAAAEPSCADRRHDDARQPLGAACAAARGQDTLARIVGAPVEPPDLDTAIPIHRLCPHPGATRGWPSKRVAPEAGLDGWDAPGTRVEVPSPPNSQMS